MVDEMNLFGEFEPVSKEAWKQKIEEDLKGKDFEELIWHTEGLKIQPFYTQEDLASTPVGHIDKGLGSEKRWSILEKIVVHTPEQANAQALEALNHGADGIIFQLLDDEVPPFDILLKSLVLNSCAIYLEGKSDVVIALDNYIKSQNLEDQGLNGGFMCSSYYLQDGLTLQSNPAFKKLFIPYSNGTIVHQLAGTLQKSVSVLDSLTDSGIAPSSILKQLIIKFEIGSSYFKEIAKLRACRILMVALAKAYHVEDIKPGHFHIHTETSWATQPDKDIHNNMLRNSTQSMSAILGGCNSLYVRPHTDREEEESFAKRIARNIPLILREEAYFDKVGDPAAGSYYIESLTRTFVEEAWGEFLKNAEL